MIGKYQYYVVLVFLFLASCFLPGYLTASEPSDNANPQLAPLDPAFQRFTSPLRKGLQPPPVITLSNGRRITPISPPPLDLDHVKGTLDETVNNTNLPASFDLRDHGRFSPEVSDQYLPSCWFHATYNSIHSLLMPAEERFFDPEIPNTQEYHGFSLQYGGDQRMSAAVLLRWDAPKEFPDGDYNYFIKGAPDSVQKHVQQVIFLPKRQNPMDNNSIKWFIMNDCAVYASLEFGGMYIDQETSAYYYYGEPMNNHAVALIGWDDNYDRNNFKRPPPTNGAFIARNSWANTWGDDGHFYVSYYDRSLQGRAVFNNAEPADNYGHIYQYDPLGAVEAVGEKSTTYWGANVFTAANNQPLAAAGFHTNDAHTSATVYIYKNLPPGTPVQGTPITTKQANFIYPGFYTVPLDTPIPLKTGERFSVVVKYENSSYNFPVPVEIPVAYYSEAARANPGESFVSRNGSKWQDLTQRFPNGNVCIKAYSKAPPPSPAAIDFNLVLEDISMWLISRTSAHITFTVKNFEDTNLHQLFIYRKEIGAPEEIITDRYWAMKTVQATDLTDNSFSYFDEDVRPGRTYAYHITAYNLAADTLAKSREITVTVPGRQEENHEIK